MALIQRAKRHFMDSFDAHTKPALSEHSTSNPFARADHHHPLYQQPAMMQQMNMDIHASNREEDAAHDDEEDNDEGDEIEGSSRSELGAMKYSVDVSVPPGLTVAAAETIPAAEASELMQLEMSEDIRVGSISDCSNNLDPEQMPAAQSICKNWNCLLEDLGNGFQQPLGIPADSKARTAGC